MDVGAILCHQLLIFSSKLVLHLSRFYVKEECVQVYLITLVIVPFLICSIWTIDLAYLLHKFSVTFSFLTVTIGANPEFSVESFYKVSFPDFVFTIVRYIDPLMGDFTCNFMIVGAFEEM